MGDSQSIRTEERWTGQTQKWDMQHVGMFVSGTSNASVGNSFSPNTVTNLTTSLLNFGDAWNDGNTTDHLAWSREWQQAATPITNFTEHGVWGISTGGFANYDASFATFQGPTEYIATVFMLASALPFVLYVQLVNGSGRPILSNSQVRAFLGTAATLVMTVAGALILFDDFSVEQAIREALFNIASILTGTGYASVDYMKWGGFIIAIFFFSGLIGGCAGSTTCSVKIFRYQILFAAVKAQIRRVHSPHGIFRARYDGVAVSEDVLSSVMAFFVLFVVTLGVFSVALAMTGLDLVTSVSGAATAVANIGPGLGDIIGPAGNFASLSDTAKWLLAAAMLIGRLELMVVYVLFTRRFWTA